MDRYSRIGSLASAVALGTGVVLANASRGFLSSLQLTRWETVALEFLIIAVASVAIRTLLESWLFLAAPLRRLLLGGQFVEGIWIDILRHDSTVVSVGIVQIRASGSSLRYGGENYDLTGRYIGHFRSDMASLSWPGLAFKYSTFDITLGSEAPGPFVQGFGEIHFDEATLPSRRYHGDCIDSLMGKRHALEGWKLDRADLRLLRDPQERGAAIVALARKYFPRAFASPFVTSTRASA